MPLLGCIADDFTGATDLANTLVSEGMRVIQVFGVPAQGLELPDSDALIVALKSRSIPAAEAVKLSLDSLAWLQEQGCERFLFKYCSTFDSTPEGNIGPVTSALMRALGTKNTIACPAFPDNGRAVYQGHLFVYGKLLSESGMENHPLNPMTDSNLVRWLQRQTQDRVDLLPLNVVEQGAVALWEAMNGDDSEETESISVVDTINNIHLRDLGTALRDLPLLTGGSGVALGLPDAYRDSGLLPGLRGGTSFPDVQGKEAILAGSCSAMTLKQIEYMKERCPSCQLLAEDLLSDSSLVEDVLRWAEPLLDNGPVLIYSSAQSEVIKAAQKETPDIGARFEKALAAVAQGLVSRGVRRLVVAGGESSGAVVTALEVTGIKIGPQIDPGVPWVETLGEHPLALALKSGNFGRENFFEKALNLLD
jgi:3-dehydrotetronate 4-kinase